MSSELCELCDLESDLQEFEDKLICESCVNLFTRCDICESYVQSSTRIDNQDICEECFESHTVKCDDCGKITTNWEELYNSEVCKNCYDCYQKCEACDTVCADSVERSNGEYLCDSCYDDTYTNCNSCGDSIPYINTNDDGYCSNCCNHFEIIEFPQNFLPSMRKYGIELETNIVCSVADKWRKHPDTSIDGNEFVSPIFKGDASKSVEEMCTKINTHSKSWGFTPINSKCGFHIHIESSDLSEDELFRFFKLCVRIEKWSYSIVSQSRQLAHPNGKYYCQPIKQFNIAKNWEDLNNKVYGTTSLSILNSKKQEKYSPHKYYWLNIHSHNYRGTLEIRHHQGTTNPQKIMNWVILWLSVLEYSIKYPDKCDRIISGITILREMGVKSDVIKYFKNRRRLFKEKEDLIEN